MRKYDIKIDHKNFTKYLHRLAADFPETQKAILVELAGEARAKSQKIAPSRTGNLRSTIRVVVEEGSVSLVAGGIAGKGSKSHFVDYAAYVNYGTSKQAPQFFMERSVAEALLDTKSIARATLQSWINANV